MVKFSSLRPNVVLLVAQFNAYITIAVKWVQLTEIIRFESSLLSSQGELCGQIGNKCAIFWNLGYFLSMQNPQLLRI